MSTPCPFCGAYSVRSCEIEGIDDGCPWDDMLNEPDPDWLREERDERRRIEREFSEPLE